MAPTPMTHDSCPRIQAAGALLDPGDGMPLTGKTRRENIGTADKAIALCQLDAHTHKCPHA